ncbi:hypothetical protein R6U77_14840 [Lysinibacillus louembei]|uniref:Uncharacterized protein n=1 Tax=Lysinibacillus louembei TaxID=1470088 RepID=A0ABZ0RW18_9BACI|nr:hypothetical protein [Lysinibacillus louembei]WPK11153.1 hypothetical protein R6U77_14840 [Lysinibacillus louembei]
MTKKRKKLTLAMMSILLLSACGITDETSGAEQPQTTTTFEEYGEYISYSSTVPEAYYQTVFAFEELESGVNTVPHKKVRAMYEEMKATFDYLLVNDYPLVYRGDYQGDTAFVDGYDQYQAGKVPNPMNVEARDWEGNPFLATPLKTLLLGDGVFQRFDQQIEEGRNLKITDYTLVTPDQPIPVVLGYAYKGIYEIGDTFSLELISEVMNFQVVGFYKQGTSFAMDTQQVAFDYTIVMPHFLFEYEPVGEAALFQHAFHLAELTSGYIQIDKPFEAINDETYQQTVDMLEKMAERHNLSGLYKVATWPVGFVW